MPKYIVTTTLQGPISIEGGGILTMSTLTNLVAEYSRTPESARLAIPFVGVSARAIGAQCLWLRMTTGIALAEIDNNPSDATKGALRSDWESSDNLSAPIVGKGIKVAEGVNAKQGISSAMTSGAVTVANTSVTANSRIMLTRQNGGTNPGAVYVSARTAGVSFAIASTNAADTGAVAYQMYEPA